MRPSIRSVSIRQSPNRLENLPCFSSLGQGDWLNGRRIGEPSLTTISTRPVRRTPAAMLEAFTTFDRGS